MAVLSLSTLEQWLTETYMLHGFKGVSLLRSHTNDVYEISASSKRFILKIYGLNWRTEDDIRYEVSLIEHLVQKGLRAAKPIAGKDDKTIYKIGAQFALLFEYAEGRKPQPPFSTDLYVAFGQAIAEMHESSNNFVTTYTRKPIDLHTLLDEPLALALPLIKAEEDRHFLLETAQTIREQMQRLNPQELDWGAIHGDATLDNLHVTDDGQIVLYDFDSGGPSWRAADLQGWAYNNPEFAEKWDAFQQGYARVRELKMPDLHAARYLSVAWLIWGLQIDLERRVLAQGEAKVAEYLAAQLDAIRAQARLAFG